jgi:hypothetical protein
MEGLSCPLVNDPGDFQLRMKKKRKGLEPSAFYIYFKPVFCFEEVPGGIDLDDQMMRMNIKIKIGG